MEQRRGEKLISKGPQNLKDENRNRGKIEI